MLFSAVFLLLLQQNNCNWNGTTVHVDEEEAGTMLIKKKWIEESENVQFSVARHVFFPFTRRPLDWRVQFRN